MKNYKVILSIIMTVLISPLSACGDTRGERALSGGGIGAGVGAVGGAVAGGNPWTGALIGGAVGAGVGAVTSKKQIDLDK